MINEYGSIRTEQIAVGEARKARVKNMLWLWIVLLIVGAIGVVAYLVGSVLEELYQSEFVWVDIALFAVVPFTVGLIFVLAIRLQKKADLNTNEILTGCEFFSDCIIFREFKDNEQLGVFRITYSQIVLVKQRASFLYCTIPQGIAYPVYLGGLTQVEINTIKKQLKLPVSEGAETIALKECSLVN